MCGRASSSRGPAALAAATGSRRFLAAQRYRPSYNLGPTNSIPVLRRMSAKQHPSCAHALAHAQQDEREDEEDEEDEEDDDDDDAKQVREDHSLARDRTDNRRDPDDDEDENDGSGGSGESRRARDSNYSSSTNSNSTSGCSSSSTSTSTLSSSSGSSSGSALRDDAAASGVEQHTLETDLNSVEPDFKGIADGELFLQSMSWGLVPFYTAPDQIHSTGYNMINARAETVSQKGTFKRLLSRNRCVVVVDGYYEWHTFTNKLGQVVKQPYFMQHKHRETLPIERTNGNKTEEKEEDELSNATCSAVPGASEWVYPSACMYLAALWDRWAPKDGDDTKQPLYTVTILTTEPVQIMGWMHDRQPVILSAQQARAWCDVDHVPYQQVSSFVSPHPLDLEWYPVTDTVSQIRNKGKECVEHKDVVLARRMASGLGRFFKPAAASSSSSSSSSFNSTSTSNTSASTTSTTSASPTASTARVKSPIKFVEVIDDDDFPVIQKPTAKSRKPDTNTHTTNTNTSIAFPSPRKATPKPTTTSTSTTPNKRKSPARAPSSGTITSMFAKMQKHERADSIESIRARHRALMEED